VALLAYLVSEKKHNANATTMPVARAYLRSLASKLAIVELWKKKGYDFVL